MAEHPDANREGQRFESVILHYKKRLAITKKNFNKCVEIKIERSTKIAQEGAFYY